MDRFQHYLAMNHIKREPELILEMKRSTV